MEREKNYFLVLILRNNEEADVFPVAAYSSSILFDISKTRSIFGARSLHKTSKTNPHIFSKFLLRCRVIYSATRPIAHHY